MRKLRKGALEENVTSKKGFSLYWRIGLIIAINLVLLIGILIQNLIVTKSARTDRLVVNMAGRQRMLTQKMTKAALNVAIYRFAASKDLRAAAAIHQTQREAQTTIRWFDTTLDALIHGGGAPTLDAKTKKETITPPMLPCTNPEIRTQLLKVKDL